VHTTYLPADFAHSTRDQEQWPLIVEFPGNTLDLQMGDWTTIGYGISAGRGSVWLTLPFVSTDDGSNRTCGMKYWWGCDPSACNLVAPASDDICRNASLTPIPYDPMPTVRYAILAVRQTIARYNIDPKRVLLTGHSRGGIAVTAIGLHNDEIAGLWTHFAPFSHLDGVHTWSWSPKNLTDYRVESLERLKRVAGRPVFIAAECGLASICARDYLVGTKIDLSNFSIYSTGFMDHNGHFALRPDPGGVRAKVRQWISAKGPAP
jgi:hypothetical protein